jgi:hypothetical protein
VQTPTPTVQNGLPFKCMCHRVSTDSNGQGWGHFVLAASPFHGRRSPRKTEDRFKWLGRSEIDAALDIARTIFVSPVDLPKSIDRDSSQVHAVAFSGRK